MKEISSKPQVLAEPILVGREKELQELQVFLNSAIEGKGRTVFVSGEAGVGKTRLINEFLNLAKKQAVTILTGWCLSNTAIPYFPFVEAFGSYLVESEEDASLGLQRLGLKTWLTSISHPEALANEQSHSPQAWKDQKFADVSNELLFLSNQRPLILFIDDLQWADSASLSLLHYVARSVNSERILIIATFRSEEIGSNAEGYSSPLFNTLRLMGREDIFKEVRLNRLDKQDVGKITADMLCGKVSGALVEKLSQESQGNPLFVVESMRMLFESSAFAYENGQWQLAVDRIGVPNKVKEIILRRLATLKPNQRRLLDVASVIGDKFDPQLLGAVLGQDSLEVLETLNGIALSRSLVCVEGDNYRFDHAKSREVLYEEILEPLKKGYHERVAERIETLSKNEVRKPLSDLAYHYSKAGNHAKSIEFNFAAGKDALARFSNTEAINHFRSVISAIGNTSDSIDKRIAALEGLGDAFFAAGLFEEAAKTFETIEDAAYPDAMKLKALRKGVISCYWLGDNTRGMQLAVKAKRYESVDRIEYARLQLYKGFVEGRSYGKAKAAVADMTASLKVFEEENSLPDIAGALAELSFALPWVDRLEDSLSCAMRSVALYEEIPDIRQKAFAIGRLGAALGACGFLHEGLNAFSNANELDRKIGDYNTMAFHFMMSGTFFESLGDFRAAIIQSLQGLEAAEKTDAVYAKIFCLTNLVRQNARIGQIEHAEEYEVMLEKLFNAHEALKSNMFAVKQASIGKGVFFLCKGQLENAIDIFEKNTALNESETNEGYAWALRLLGRNAEAETQFERLKEFYDRRAARFAHSNLLAYILSLRTATVGEEMNLRIDLINTGKYAAKIARIKDLVTFNCKVVSLPSNIHLEGDSLEFAQKTITALGTETIKLSLIPLAAGVFNLQPAVIYIDEARNSKLSKIAPMTLTVKSKSAPTNNLIATGEKAVKMEFKSVVAQKTFEYLVKAFNDDTYQKSTKDSSGWRTLMDVVRKGKVSKYSVYGASGRGTAIQELERRGLIEARFFEGERGRGGKILRIRIAIDKEDVQRSLEPRK
ncbi:MAG TPA: AAA family ATPase [Candidatus Nanoarchaeia archaeon]|nr:AAA family ATPase [Candidatus Nanoarchaeia archaeon]